MTGGLGDDLGDGGVTGLLAGADDGGAIGDQRWVGQQRRTHRPDI